MPRRDGDHRGSLVSLTEEQEDLGQHGKLHDLVSLPTPTPPHTPTHAHNNISPFRCHIFTLSRSRPQRDAQKHPQPNTHEREMDLQKART